VSPDKKGKGLASAENNSPGTPLECLQEKVDASPGPWSKTLLENAKNFGVSDLLKDTSLRRSKRMEKQKNGFKDKHCSRKDCLGCTVVPPTISPSVINNLGTTFCNLDEDSLTVPTLSKKKMAIAPVGKKPPKKKPPTKDDADDKLSKKKPKK
jgi:hypothetical protein